MLFWTSFTPSTFLARFPALFLCSFVLTKPLNCTTPFLRMAARSPCADGPIKTFPLRGIKDSPPYFHDGRLLTLEDTVEFLNLILGTRLSAEEKGDLLAFLHGL